MISRPRLDALGRSDKSGPSRLPARHGGASRPSLFHSFGDGHGAGILRKSNINRKNIKRRKTMTKAELKQMYPTLCKEIFEEGRFAGLSGQHGDAAQSTVAATADVVVQAAEKYRDRN
jgi:hypothetical protein